MLSFSHGCCDHDPRRLILRPAVPADAAVLRRWDEEPHVLASDPNDDWQWETELRRTLDWRGS